VAEGDRVAADDLRPGVLAAYAIPIINPDIPSRLERACEVIVWATWVLFGLDFIVRVVLAVRRPR